MILVNVQEKVVEMLKKDRGLFLASPTYSVGIDGFVRENQSPNFVPIPGILAICNNRVLLNNTTRLIAHLKKSNKPNESRLIAANNFILCNIVDMDSHVVVYDDSTENDDFIIWLYQATMKDIRQHDDVELVCYYGVLEYMNISRSMGTRVTSSRAFPQQFTEDLLSGIPEAVDTLNKVAQNPYEQDYLFHHSGFMQDALRGREYAKQVPYPIEEHPIQYYPSKQKCSDEVIDWSKASTKPKGSPIFGHIKPRKVEGMLQEAPNDVYAEPVMGTEMPNSRGLDGIDSIDDVIDRVVSQNQNNPTITPVRVYKVDNDSPVMVEYVNNQTGDRFTRQLI